MVKISYNPVKEIIIDEIVAFDSIKEFEETILPNLVMGQPVMLRWAEGVLFSYDLLPISETIIKNRLKGILYVNALAYTMMPKYQSKRTIEPQDGGKYTYGILDVSRTANLVELTKWLKEHDKTKR